VNNYNRRVRIAACDIRGTGASAVVFVGDPAAVRNPLFEYHQRQNYDEIDTTPGPQTDNYPADCTVEDCLLRRFGAVEKQATGVQISMARGITIRHCSIYEAPRAGINISEGTWGGHLVEFCDVFDTVRETGDHGSFNSWGRDRFWRLEDAPDDRLPELALLDATEPTVLRNNRWRCDHGWDVDLDDGSSNYEIYNNVFLRGGLKLREGFHRRVWNNIAVGNTLHPHVWYDNSGDSVTKNIFMGAYRPAGGMPNGKWGAEIDHNLFTTSDADRTKFAAHGCDPNSVVGDPLFLDPAHGDYRVREGSPALQLGFENFPMDRFGVRDPQLRKIARTPDLPAGEDAFVPPGDAALPAVAQVWREARVRDIEGQAYSAFGISREAGGVHLVSVPEACLAWQDGFRTDDVIQSLNDRPVRGLADLFRERDAAGGRPLSVGIVRAQSPRTVPVASYAYCAVENRQDEDFRSLPLAPADDIHAIRRVLTRPRTANQPPAALHDGRLAEDYGPVFRNRVVGGSYKVDLGKAVDISEISVWSYDQNGSRGPQRFALFGSSRDDDPGWNTDDRAAFVPIGSVDTRGVDVRRFLATRLSRSDGTRLGTYRWLVWVLSPVTEAEENTAFQEIQIR
jgi:hypothetical protein